MIYWDRPTLKLRAKEVLRTTYWMSFLATFIYGIVMGAFSGGSAASNSDNIHWSTNGGLFYNGHATQELTRLVMAVMPFLIAGATVASLIGIVYAAFVGNMAEIGKNRFFTLCRYNTVNIEEMLFGFKNGKYMSNVKTMFLRGLYTFLWSLLFVIPGIIKGYSYWMMPYILAENPNISTDRAFDISMRTTQGEKWEMFVLDLSFIGWYILGGLACGVGILFVRPYHEAAKAELYGALRFKAVNAGIADRSEIGAEL